jgi:hypothetical protein
MQLNAMRANRRTVARFHLQPTASFPEIAPQREEYADDRAYDRACVAYANEWRETYLCAGCSDVACPQCGAEGVTATIAPAKGPR